MADKRYPSIFDIFENFMRGFPFDRKGIAGGDLFRGQFDDLIKRFEEAMPADWNDEAGFDDAQPGNKRYGPFVYGFSYTAEPGKEPVFQEFGNIKPSRRGIEPSTGREPLVDVMDDKDKYKIYVELPGVDKANIKLDVAEDSLEVSTKDEKKFYKMIYLDSSVNPDSSKASYNNGVLTVELDKKAKRVGKEVSID
jgi:HSP20 family protein